MFVSPISGRGPLAQAMATAASGMQAQATRLRVVSENIANSQSTSTVPGGDAYRRKTITFDQAIDRVTGASVVRPARIGTDPSAQPLRFDPSHPAADAQGYVRMPNVSSVIEMADLREASRTYEANLSAMAQARTMLTRTVEILRG